LQHSEKFFTLFFFGSDALYAYFIDRVRDHLHMVLCMSPVGDGLRERCRMYPALVNCTSIDWFSEWPDVALREVSARFLLGADLGGCTFSL
jgi:dynein heavy chain